MVTPYPAHEKVAIALSVLGHRDGRPADVVLTEIDMILRGATNDEIAMTRHLEAAEESASPTALYRAYDADGRLLYAGVSKDVTRRLEEHRKNSHWHHAATRIQVAEYPSRALALAEEARCHETTPPMWGWCEPSQANLALPSRPTREYEIRPRPKETFE